MRHEAFPAELVRMFAAEATGLALRLEGEVRLLIDGGREGPGRALIDRVFLTFHTIAGSAEVLCLPGPALQARSGEEAMILVRRGERAISDALVEELLDRVRRLKQELARLVEREIHGDGGASWTEC